MPVGHSHVWGVPLACLGCFLPAWHDEGPGCRCGSGLLSSGAGSARCVSRLWCAERALGRPEGGAGETGGNPGLWGGCPRCPPRCLQASAFGRHGAVCVGRAERGSRPVFLGHGCGGVRRCCRGRQEGVWGNLEPGRVFAGPGGFRVLPVRFRIGPSFCLFTCVVEL